MSRPAANTEAGYKATEKWRKTMLERFGSEEAVRKHLEEMGRKGGKASGTGGWYGDPERARRDGALGGKTSKRGYKFIKRVGNEGEYINNKTGKIVRFPL